MILVSSLKIVLVVVQVTTLLDYIFTVIGNPSLLSVLGARILINMKEAGEKGLNQGTGCRPKSTLSGIDCAVPTDSSIESSLSPMAREHIINNGVWDASMQEHRNDAAVFEVVEMHRIA